MFLITTANFSFAGQDFSIDLLKMGLIRSGNTILTPEDDAELMGCLWPIVREMIKTALENQQNLIVEGCYIPFRWEEDFDSKYRNDIRFYCLAMTSSYIDSHFDDIKKYAMPSSIGWMIPCVPKIPYAKKIPIIWTCAENTGVIVF